MNCKKKTYTKAQRFSSLLMILTLLWLTVSVSFVFSGQEDARMSKQSSASLPSDNEEESANPFGNNTEEKNPGSTSFSEEYLHHTETDHSFITSSIAFESGDHCRLYVAFHGELLVPPPNIA